MDLVRSRVSGFLLLISLFLLLQAGGTTTAAACISVEEILEESGEFSGRGCDHAATIGVAQSAFPLLVDEAPEVLAPDRPHVLAASNALTYPPLDFDRAYASTRYALELLERQGARLNSFQYWTYRYLLEHNAIARIEDASGVEMSFSRETLGIQVRAARGLREDLDELDTFFGCFARLDIPGIEWRLILNSRRFESCLAG